MSLSNISYFNDLVSLSDKYISKDSRDLNFYSILYLIKDKHGLSISYLIKNLYNMILNLPTNTVSIELLEKLKKYNRQSDISVNYDKLLDYFNLWKNFFIKVNQDNNKCMELFNTFNNNTVIFYDDNIENKAESSKCPNTKFVKIEVSNKPLNQNIYNDYLNILSSKSNEMIELLKRKNFFLNYDESYDHNSGINISYIRFLILYLSIESNNIKGVIFDWDRTLTVIEGVYDYKDVDTFMKLNGLENMNQYYLSEYYFGGSVRVYYLKKLWQLLNDKGIPVYILSRNEGIISSPNMFIQLLSNIGIHIDKDKLHCCYYDKINKKHINSTKYNYIKNFLPELCL